MSLLSAARAATRRAGPAAPLSALGRPRAEAHRRAHEKGTIWKVTGTKDVAGKKIAVGSGTDQATYLALGSGQIDAYLGPTAAYHVAVAGQTEIIGTYSGAGAALQGEIAFTTKKDSGLVKALHAGLNELIKSGDYAKILARWNLSNEAVTSSEINPPGLPIEGK